MWEINMILDTESHSTCPTVTQACKVEKNEAYQRQETSDSFSSSSTYSTQGRRELEPVHQLSSVLFI